MSGSLLHWAAKWKQKKQHWKTGFKHLAVQFAASRTEIGRGAPTQRSFRSIETQRILGRHGRAAGSDHVG
jgi:hypothetical protein